MALLPSNGDVIIKENAGIIRNVIQGFAWIREHEVLVGVPQEKAGRKTEGPDNAQLLYIHTQGSPARNIPARPTIEPAIQKHENANRIQELLLDGMRTAFTGNLNGAEAAWSKAGMVGARAAQERFGSDELAPNAPYTIAKKGSSKPLIDTGALRAAVTYVIRKKKR